MDERMDRELQAPESWDDASAQLHEPRTQRRAVVSVAFPSEDLESVSEAARSNNMKLSEFIRTAALEKSRHQGRPMRAVTIRTSGNGSSRGSMTDVSPMRPRFTKAHAS